MKVKKSTKPKRTRKYLRPKEKKKEGEGTGIEKASQKMKIYRAASPRRSLGKPLNKHLKKLRKPS